MAATFPSVRQRKIRSIERARGRPAQIVLTFAAAIATQDLWSRATGRSPVVYRSALTALGLALLLRG